MELTAINIAFIITLAFFCEYMDSTLGMGYGTTMTPLLLLFGFSPFQIVPAILLSELITGVFAGILHNKAGNVDFSPKALNLPRIGKSLQDAGLVDRLRKGMTRHLKIVVILVSCSMIGAVSAVFTAKVISKFWQQIYIGTIVISMGVVILLCLNRTFRFSWIKIVLLGVAASFNKGLTGGGYGPLVVSGQLLSGVESKNAIGITSMAEGITSLVGVITYLVVINNGVDWRLAPIITVGAVASVPLSVRTVKKMDPRKLKLFIGILTIILGAVTILKTLR